MTNIDELKLKINVACPNAILTEDCDMAKHTTFRAGGKAALMVEVRDMSELKACLGILNEAETPHILLGNGSNTLFKDSGYPGVVLKLQEESPAFNFVEFETADATESKGEAGEFGEKVRVTAGAAMLMSAFARTVALKEGLAGFEPLSGIPGSLGGAMFMNAGAYGSEMKNVVISCHAISPDGAEERDFTVEEADLGYRHSVFMENGWIVTSVTFELTRDDRENILQRMKEFAEKRNSKQPVQYPSAGSTFKRPTGYFAGALIEEAGLKGTAVGGAMVSELHAGFIINTGEATATDIVELIAEVKARVLENSGVELEPEVRIIG